MPKHFNKYILLNNLGSRHSLLMKSGQVMSCEKRKIFIKKFYKNCHLKTSSTFFRVWKEMNRNFIGKLNQLAYVRFLITKRSKFVKIIMYTSSDSFLQRILWKLKRAWISRPYFSQNFLIMIFLLQSYINWPYFITKLCLLSKLSSKIRFMFHAQAFDDVMTYKYLKSWNLIVWRTKGAFEVKSETFYRGHRSFPVNFAKFVRTPFLTEHLR